jgi:hypothetical protein
MLSESSKREYLMKINKLNGDFNIVREGDYENIFKLKFGQNTKTIIPWKVQNKGGRDEISKD